jgi:SIR2-like domain
MSEPSESHYDTVLRAIADGRVVPLLGAGVNLCGRPEGTAWQHGRYLPSGAELAAHLAGLFAYPEDELVDLLRVSQYVEVMLGSGPLYDKLHELFDADYPPSPVHELLAGLPKRLGLAGRRRYQLIMTTNYDDALERAFRAAGEDFDLVWYIAEAEHRGKFLHLPPDGEPRLISRPNEYDGLSLEERTVILKIHGAIDRRRPERDSYVITEDHYIDYLTRTDVSTLVPVTLGAVLRHSHFLFLGYSMRDWNLRVMLHRIWAEQSRTYKSWAIQLHPNPIDDEFWHRRGVDVLDTSLEEYVAGLTARIQWLQTSGVG